MADEGIGASIGNLIKDQLSQSIKNVDVISLLQKLLTTKASDEKAQLVQDQLKGIMEQYSGLNDEDKEKFVHEVRDAIASKLARKLKDVPMDFSGVEDAIKDAVKIQLYYTAAGVILLIFLLVFFGYKLYKSIKEKEKKKEEKKKLKQMKKKK